MQADMPAIDTVIFDIDGVLIDTSTSFLPAVISAAEFLLRRSVPESESVAIHLQDLQAFRRAGGFNDDADALRAVSALLIAQQTVWRGSPRGSLPLYAFAQKAASAYAKGKGGLVWLSTVVPAECIPSAELAREVVYQYYWGHIRYSAYFGQPRLSVGDTPGFIDQETLLAQPDLLVQLSASGVTKYGIISGRMGPGLEWAIKHLTRHFGIQADAVAERKDHGTTIAQWHSFVTNVVDGTMYLKPDPLALEAASKNVGSTCGLFIGDTRDDLNLVLRYRHELPARARAVPFGSVIVVSNPRDRTYFKRLGADMVVNSMDEVVALVSNHNSSAAPPKE